MKVRIKFRKQGVMKFIGHLDVMRYFQKAIRRADIDIAYTEGFSPHMILSFAAPLGVGLTSKGEYADLTIKTPISSREAVKRLNEVMVEGMEIISFRQIPEEKASNAMSLVTEADYTLQFREGMEPPEGWEEKLLAFYDKASIPVLKKNKKERKRNGSQTSDLSSEGGKRKNIYVSVHRKHRQYQTGACHGCLLPQHWMGNARICASDQPGRGLRQRSCSAGRSG